MKSRTHHINSSHNLRRSRSLITLLALLLLSEFQQSGRFVEAISPGVHSVVTSQNTPMLAGTFQVVSDGPDDQIDPHADCDLASYTNDFDGTQSIRYFNFATNTDAPVPTTGEAFLSDVQGTRVVFTNVTPAGSNIVTYDTATDTSFTVPGGNRRTDASVGGSLIAFDDRGFSADPNESEVVVYDLATNTTTRLTGDAQMDVDPQVSPSGNEVVWVKCQTDGLGCDIYAAAQVTSGVFTTTQLTGPEGDESNADTNGTVAVYTSARAGETDIFFKPVAGGTETQLAIPGEQRNPSISGSLISFESFTSEGNFDLFVYDISTGAIYRVTETAVDETLNDITVCSGRARIVYSAPGANGDFDVYAFTFSPPTCDVCDSDGDGIADTLDQCPNTPPNTQVNGAGCPDADGDGVADATDNCPTTPNTTQADADGDGIGDACEANADIRVTKAAQSSVRTGSRLPYVITVRNNGPNSAPNVVVTDSAPAGTTLLNAYATRGTCTTAGNVATCNIGPLNNGQWAGILLVVRVNATPGAIITNTAAGGSPHPDPNPSNNSASATTRVVRKQDDDDDNDDS